jgi:hypothetical protein
MDSYLRECARKISFFIDTCYYGKGRDFAKQAGLTESTLSRIRAGNDFNISKSVNFEKAGLNPLFIAYTAKSGISMFANNDLGKQLKSKFGDIAFPKSYSQSNSGEVALNRAAEWIKNNYGSIKDFLDSCGLEYSFTEDSVNGILNLKIPPDYYFYEMLRKAGCTMEYLASHGDEAINGSAETYNSHQIKDIIESTVLETINNIKSGKIKL